ncbi:MAG: PIG-L family deacetylase [Nitrososphaera sp.]|nr:PIG-L family deacetylase [Nitrososphaera sp.]
MITLKLGCNKEEPKEFLLIGAHCDDIEIGCGGVVLRLAKAHSQITLHWVVFSSNEQRAAEARDSADLFLANVLNKTVTIKDFRNGYFPYVGTAIKDYFEELKQTTKPDVIFTHYGQDYHQDHRVLSDLTWNTFRNHFILEYEIPKYDGGLGSPNVFFPLHESEYQGKVEILLECFGSERSKSWFTKDTFLGLMRLRGLECNAPSGYAEAFYCRKAVI